MPLNEDNTENMIRRFGEAFNTDDLDTVMEYFAEDAVYNEIDGKKGIHTVSSKLIPVSELFGLQGTYEMKENEKKFLVSGKEPVNAVILAAGAPNEGPEH